MTEYKILELIVLRSLLTDENLSETDKELMRRKLDLHKKEFIDSLKN